MKLNYNRILKLSSFVLQTNKKCEPFKNKFCISKSKFVFEIILIGEILK